MGGALVTASKPLPRIVPATTPARRAQMAEYKAMKRDLCGHVMRTSGEPCARRKGHSPDHKTARQMEHDALRRRARSVQTERVATPRGAYRHKGPLDEEAA